MSLTKKKSLSVLQYYFISYFLVFLIPFVILGLFVYTSAVHTLRNEVETANRYKLEQARSFLDKQLKSLNETAVLMARDHRLSPYIARSDDYNSMEAVKELVRYQRGSPLLEELFLYFRQDDKIFSASGVISLETLMEKTYRFPSEQDSRRFLEDLNHGEGISLKPATTVTIGEQKEKRLLSYWYPLPPLTFPAYGTVLFLIDEAVLTDMMRSVLGGFQGDVYLLNENGEILASQRIGQTPGLEVWRDYLNKEIYGSAYKIRIDAQDYSVMGEKSEISGLSYLIVMPTDQFWSRAVEFKQLVLLLLALVLFLGLCGTAAVSFRSSLPIRALVSQLQGKPAPAKRRSARPNELEWISSTFNDMFDYTSQLEVELEHQRPLVEDQVIYHLLKGNTGSPRMRDAAALFPPELTTGGYFVAVLSLEAAGMAGIEPRTREKVYNMIRRFEFDQGRGGGLELLEERVMAIIVSVQSPAEELRQLQEQVADMLQFSLTEQAGVSPQIAIGSVCQEQDMIHRSFIEAMAALDYRLAFQTGKPIFFDDIAHLEDKVLWYSFGDQARFSQSLKQGDYTVSLEAFHGMLDSMAQKEQSILLLRCMCFDMVNSVLKLMKELNIGDDWPEKKAMMEFQTLDDLRQRMTVIIGRICGHINSRNQSRYQELLNRLLEFINQNSLSGQMSLELVSRELGLSISYISRFIHEHTGMTFSEYVYRLRMEKVKEELIATDKPLKDIILQVGYVDVSNFIKKFRKQEGMTPGDYRRRYGGLKREEDSSGTRLQ